MLGAITGDIIGSIYEWDNIKTKSFKWLDEKCFFTDDTILTVALANSILTQRDFSSVMKQYYKHYKHYPKADYGERFHIWASYPNSPAYNSWGNGTAMRTSPVGYVFNNLNEVLQQAKYFASFTHNHPEGFRIREVYIHL